MIDKEKLRAEIVRLQNVTMDKFGNFNSAYSQGEYDALCALEHFIDSLPEEQVSEDLEEAADEYANSDEFNDKAFLIGYDEGDLAKCFIEGAKWQREHIKATMAELKKEEEK